MNKIISRYMLIVALAVSAFVAAPVTAFATAESTDGGAEAVTEEASTTEGTTEATTVATTTTSTETTTEATTEATVEEVAYEIDLVMDQESHTFANMSDGTFNLAIAKKAKYYQGYAVDKSTKVKYVFVKYDDNIYAVCASSRAGANGSYDESTYDLFGSSKHNTATSKTTLNVKKNKTGNTLLASAFYYTDDFAIVTTGYSRGIYYVDNAKAKGVYLVGNAYYFFKKGIRQDTEGWYKYKKVYYYVGKNSKLKYKFTGTACYKYKKKKLIRFTNGIVDVNGTSYFFDKNGNFMNGFKKVNGNYYYLKNGVAKTKYYTSINGFYYYFGSDGKAVKSAWITYKKQVMYFNNKGKCTKVFYKTNYKKSSLAGKYKTYSKKTKKWSYVTTGVYKINGTYMYFKKGKVKNSTCWCKDSDSLYYYVLKGTVTYKLTYSEKIYTLYYMSDSGNWVKAKDIWMPAKDGMSIYFDADGDMLYRYMDSTYATTSYRETVWAFDSGTEEWVKQKSTLVQVNGYYYYAASNGYLCTDEGWTTIDDTSAVYTEAGGKVSAYVYYDSTLGASVYKTGYDLVLATAGVYEAVINSTTVYYLIGDDGLSTSGSITINGYSYTFDDYGMSTTKLMEGGIVIDADTWLSRVMAGYLGKTGYSCSQFVYYALALAGGSDATVANALKYTSASTGGILLDSAFNSTAWGGGSEVTGTMTLSDGTDWLAAESSVINANITDFSYDMLSVGDVIVYCKSGETTANHVAIYIGQFDSASDLKTYLISLGVSSSDADSYVKTWGSSYNNDTTHWVIHGGMGSSSQIYISNSSYCIPVSSSGDYEYAKKIVHVFD